MPRLMKPGPAMVLMGVMLAYAPFSVTQKPGAGLVKTVRSATGEPTIAQIGSDLATGHPLTRMVEGRSDRDLCQRLAWTLRRSFFS